MELSARQHWLQDVTCIERALLVAGTDDGVQLIDKHEDLTLGFADLIKHRLQSLLELTTVLRTGDEGTHVEGEDLLILQTLRYLALRDALCETLDDGGLTDTRLTDQHRVILALTAEDTDDISYLIITTDDRIILLILRTLDHLVAVLVQGIIAILRVVGHDTLITSHLSEGLQEAILRDAVLLEQLLQGRIRLLHKTEENVLHGNILIAHGLRMLLRLRERQVRTLREVHLTGTRDLRKTADLIGEGRLELLHRHTHLLQKLCDQTVIDGDQRVEKMNLLHILISIFTDDILTVIDRFD